MPIDLVVPLSNAAIRACALGLIAYAGLLVFRVRSSAARHAAWSVVVLGMILQLAFGRMVPDVRFRVLPAAAAPSQRATTGSPPMLISPGAIMPTSSRSALSRRSISWAAWLTGVYLVVSAMLFARMALGLWGLRRILRHAKPRPELGRCFLESASFVVPASVGCFQPKIVLPIGWRDWDRMKLQAVIAHESAHTRRRDWLISFVSHVNVCIFWFHPLAWWMDRELAHLAEEACDDIALSQMEDRDRYAATLVEFARATAANAGLVHWGAISMAKESNVARRVNRIMVWGLTAAKPFGQTAWIILLACSIPVIYLSAAVKLAPANRPAAAVQVQPHEPAPAVLRAQAAPKPPIRSAPAAIPPGRLSMCIVVDNSGSMSGKQSQAKAAALALVGASQSGDELCIVNFSDDAFLDADLTTDFDKARDALRQVDARGGSALRDAIAQSVDLIEQKAHNRKVLVLITDGDDTSSGITEEQVRDKVKNSGILVYSIALLSDKGPDAARARAQLAEFTGGFFYAPARAGDMETIASEIGRAARLK